MNFIVERIVYLQRIQESCKQKRYFLATIVKGLQPLTIAPQSSFSDSCRRPEHASVFQYCSIFHDIYLLGYIYIVCIILYISYIYTYTYYIIYMNIYVYIYICIYIMYIYVYICKLIYELIHDNGKFISFYISFEFNS